MNMHRMLRSAAMAGTAIVLIGALPAASQAQRVTAFNLPAQDLGEALTRLGRQAGEQIVFTPESVAGRQAKPVHGSMTSEQALQLLLRGSGLAARSGVAGGFVVAGFMRTAAVSIQDQRTPSPLAPEPAPSAEPEQPAEDIVVTGIRASIASAAAQKRDATGILDAISSEDLGKFPDANVAESLQRIPGVAIDRTNGEGSQVSVRGLGPTFNTVLFNGRSFASDNYSRAFSFDLLPAELISGAQVYKSAQAPLQSGGIGATINVQTPRPLDLGGFKAVLTGKGLYEKNSDRLTPQAFGLISDTFADGRVGLLASLSYQKRIAQVSALSNRGYLPNSSVGPNDAPLATGVYAPRNLDINVTRDARTRLGATLVAQFKPTEDLTFTLDGLYNRFKSNSVTRGLGNWFEPTSYTAVDVNSDHTVTSLTTNGNADFLVSGGLRDTTTWEGGFNAEWKPSETLRMTLDATWSRARNAGGGRGFATVIGVPTPYSYTAGDGQDLPTVNGYADGVLTDASRARNHIASIGGNNVVEEVQEYRWNTELKPDMGLLQTVRFGLLSTTRNKSNATVGSNDDLTCAYCGYPTLTDPTLLHPVTVGGLGDAKGSLPTTFLTYDAFDYLNFLASPAATSALDAKYGLAPGTTAARYARFGGYAVAPRPGATRVKETVWSSYVDVDFSGELGGMPWLVNLGTRYEYTELTSSGSQRQLVDLTPTGGNPPTDPTIYVGVFASNGDVPVAVKSSYDSFLPTLNAQLKLTPTLQARFAAYKTLTRPSISDLAPSLDFTALSPATLLASGGNPQLRPYTAKNLDLSLEWYPARTTTLSAAVFYKKIDDFIIQLFGDELFPIANGGNAQGVRLPVGGGIVDANTARFSVRRPRNGPSLDVKGLELNVVHTLDWLPGVLSGLGIQANATFVGTNRDFDVSQVGQSFAAEGIGNSQNATLFYEKYGVSARIAYNRRERFLRQLAGGAGNEPIFVRDYGQFDGSIAVNVTPVAQLFVEGTNIFNAKYYTTGRFDDQLLSYENFGPRYDVGFRLSF